MEEFFAILLLLGTGSSNLAGFSQAHWRWRKNDGSETTATWRASQDFPGTVMDSAGICLRIEVHNGLGRAKGGVVGLQYQRGTTGIWISVGDVAAWDDFALAGSSPYVTDGQSTTSQIYDSDGGSFAGGRELVSTWQFTDTLDAGTRKEYEWHLQPTAAYAPNVLYQFRMSFGRTLPYGSPLPGLMIRSAQPISGNTGIYRDSSVTAFFDRDSGWIASDGCFSVPLSDGRVLWNMGDSYIGHYNAEGGTLPCLFQVRNSVLVQPIGNWRPSETTTLIGNAASIPSYFRNDADDNHLLWPNAGYQRGDTVHVYCMNIVNASGGLGFASGGNDCIANISLPGLQIIGFDSLQNFNGITFGLGFDTAEPGNYIYTWGVKSAYITGDIFVARFPRNDVRSTWSFWNGSAWDTAVSHIATIATGASNSVFVAKVRNRYVLVSTEFSVGCDAGTRIYVATSDQPTGPFSARKTLYTIPDDVLGHKPFFYAPVLHPEYINSRNEILLTYDINGYGNCSPFCVNDEANPDYYRPRGLRVPLEQIDSSIIKN